MLKKVALINDLSGYGKCSINAQIPIISAFGDVASCCLTSYLSNHTGYEKKYKIDLNDDLNNVLDMWNQNNFKFDGIITGYIGNADSILNVREYIADQKIDNDKVLVLVDPVFADNGKMYCEMTEKHVENYKKLMEIATVITPNITEACMLTGVDYESIRVKFGLLKTEKKDEKDLEKLSKQVLEILKDVMKRIVVKRSQITIITGIELFNSVVTVLDVNDKDKNIIQTTCNYVDKLDSRPGSGDLFDALFMETSLFGYSLIDCLNIASNFVHNAIRFCNDKNIKKEEGIIYEPILIDNMIALRKATKEKKPEEK